MKMDHLSTFKDHFLPYLKLNAFEYVHGVIMLNNTTDNWRHQRLKLTKYYRKGVKGLVTTISSMGPHHMVQSSSSSFINNLGTNP